jgi:hypothetical protein
MCKFFSFISDGNGNFQYFDRDLRLKAINRELKDKSGNLIEYEKTDSHAAIAAYFGKDEDKHNKYEYLADEDRFVVDIINTSDDSKQAEAWAKSLPYALLAGLKNYNSGNYNSGHYNSGNRNSGNYNSGNYNSGNCNSGLFNTNEPNVRIFNRQSKIPRTDQRIQAVLGHGPSLHEWVPFDQMKPEEKKAWSKAETCGGYLKKMDYKEAWKTYWGSARQDIKDRFLNLPFFDCKIFEEITGVNVSKDFADFKARKRAKQ